VHPSDRVILSNFKTGSNCVPFGHNDRPTAKYLTRTLVNALQVKLWYALTGQRQLLLRFLVEVMRVRSQQAAHPAPIAGAHPHGRTNLVA
jgi:hypothetical protein